MARPQRAATGIEQVHAEYDRLASFYDRRWRRYIDATLRIVDEVIRCEAPGWILDAPCGTGELEQRLAGRSAGLQLVGVDVSHGMLRQAAVKNADRSALWLRADVSTLPLADASFDLVVCANSFHYFRSATAALAELCRVLRPGGRLVLVDWCDDYRMCKLCSAWLRWSDPAFYRTYSTNECRSLLEQAGLAVVDQRQFRVGWVWGMMRFVGRRS
jgi:ubiquinone/menaquinone biosynthesis C-methylase UbiE